MLTYFKVEIICKQRVELYTEQTAFGQKSCSCFDACHEAIRLAAACKYNSFTTKSAHLSAAYIEHIRKLCYVFKRDIGIAAHDAVAEPGSIDVEIDIVLFADACNLPQFVKCVQRAVFGWMRDIHHAREHHMRMSRIVPESFEASSQILSFEFAVISRNRYNLMPAVFYRAGFMDIDMTRIRGDHTLVLLEHCGDDCHVRLSPSDKQLNIRIFTSARSTDLFFCAFAVMIIFVARKILEIGLNQPLQYLRMSSCNVIAFK